jgi:predicted NACHT family NTPase
MHWLPRIRLSPLSDSQLRRLVGNWLEHDTSEIEQFFKTASRLPAIFQILRVPLLGTLTILVYKNLKDLPENKNRLYAMFIDLLLGGWNLAKGIKRHSQFSSTSKLTALTRLAGMLHLSKAKECGRNMLQSSLKQAVPTLKDKAASVLVELVEDGLLIPTGRDSYIFPHLSFQEYLAARDVDPTGGAANRILRAFLDGEEWWREVISFLIGMSSNPPRLEAWVLGVSQQAKENARAPIPEIEARTDQALERIIEAFPDYQLTIRRPSKQPPA